jgi:hypothetical protein
LPFLQLASVVSLNTGQAVVAANAVDGANSENAARSNQRERGVSSAISLERPSASAKLPDTLESAISDADVSITAAALS